MQPIDDTPYDVDNTLLERLSEVSRRVAQLRADGALAPETLHRLRRFFKIKNVYNSNAIEGNVLDIGETRLVVEQGLWPAAGSGDTRLS